VNDFHSRLGLSCCIIIVCAMLRSLCRRSLPQRKDLLIPWARCSGDQNDIDLRPFHDASDLTTSF
jgi:hypothetical protein